jgi:hypothetical protein
MNIEKKILRLLEHGFNTSTLADLNAKQIEALYDRLDESKKENKEAVMVSKTNKAEIDKLKQTGSTFEVYEGDDAFEKDAEQDYTSQEGPHDAGDMAPDGMDDDSDNDRTMMAQTESEVKEKFESKKQQKYFFAKCGDGKTKEQKKWCKMAKEFADSTKNFSKLPEKKDETSEEFSFKDYLGKIGSVVAANTAKNVSNTLKPTFEGKLEESIMKMVNKHITPKMTKKDFIKTITEAEREVETPVKPDVDTPSKPKPATPYQPKHKPAPKAGEREVETPVKPDVKPERPRPATPYQPKHKPAPKAEDIPQWLTFDAIGINFK